MNTAPLVSLITLNDNQTEVTCALLESVQHLSYPNIEVIMVDNHSVQNPAPFIEERNFRNTRVIVNDENLDFPGEQRRYPTGRRRFLSVPQQRYRGDVRPD